MEATKIREYQRRTNLRADEIQLFKEAFVIVPYQPSGYLDYTNRGFSDETANSYDFETFKRVWTGNDAFTITWKGSTTYTHISGEDATLSFQLGEVFLGTIETNGSENQIIIDKSFSDYKSQQIKKTITFKVDAFFNITPNYQFMFYKIPEYSGSMLYRISNIERDYIGNELVGYVITFETINQELANTGKARQQNVMPNAPGQGYLECVVEDETWPERIGEEQFLKLRPGIDYYPFYNRYITADWEKTRNRPISKVVFKAYGNGNINSVSFVGRPAEFGDSFQNFRASRLIFPINFSQATTPNLYRTQSNCNNFYWIKMKPTFLFYKEFSDLLATWPDPVKKMEYMGFMYFQEDEYKKTNPSNDGSAAQAFSPYKWSIWGGIEQKQKPNGETYYDYTPWTFSTNDVEYVNTKGIIGLENSYDIGGEKAIWDHMWDAYWTQKQYQFLPMNTTTTLAFSSMLNNGFNKLVSGGLGNIIYGSILYSVGIIGSLVEKLRPRGFQGMYGLSNAPFIDYNVGLFATETIEGLSQRKIPLSFWDNGKDDNVSSSIMNNQTMNIAFSADLTDIFQKEIDGTPKILSTVNIAQKTYENGSNIYNNGQELLLNGKERLETRNLSTEGYIIDKIQIQGVFNGEYSIEFIDSNGDIAWSGVYQSEGKWTNSLREIWTQVNTSIYNRENLFFAEPLPYPKPIDLPPPDIVDDVAYNRQLTFNSTASYKYILYGGSVIVNSNNDFTRGYGDWYTHPDFTTTTTYNLLVNKTEEWIKNNISFVRLDVNGIIANGRIDGAEINFGNGLNKGENSFLTIDINSILNAPNKTLSFTLTAETGQDLDPRANGKNGPLFVAPTSSYSIINRKMFMRIKFYLDIDIEVKFENNFLKFSYTPRRDYLERNLMTYFVPNSGSPSTPVLASSQTGGFAVINYNQQERTFNCGLNEITLLTRN